MHNIMHASVHAHLIIIIYSNAIINTNSNLFSSSCFSYYLLFLLSFRIIIYHLDYFALRFTRFLLLSEEEEDEPSHWNEYLTFMISGVRDTHIRINEIEIQ